MTAGLGTESWVSRRMEREEGGKPGKVNFIGSLESLAKIGNRLEGGQQGNVLSYCSGEGSKPGMVLQLFLQGYS